MIEVKNVSFGYGTTHNVKDVCFSMNPGEFVAIIGSNGAGKSTISKLIRGLIRPNAGKVFIDGTDISTVKASSLASKIGFLFQNPDRQICKNTVAQELLFTLEYTVADKKKRQELLEQTLSDFALDREADPFNMSRGERQKIALASVLVNQPEILILDEPTTGLDYRECIQIMDVVSALNQKGVTVIMVTHDMELVLDYVSRVIVMAQGRVVADGNPKDIFYQEEVLAKASLLPPQIVGLSSSLSDQRFEKIYTVEEMTAAIIKASGKEVAT